MVPGMLDLELVPREASIASVTHFPVFGRLGTQAGLQFLDVRRITIRIFQLQYELERCPLRFEMLGRWPIRTG